MNEFLQLAFIGMVERLEKATGEKVVFTNEDFEDIVERELAVDFGDSEDGKLVLFTVSEKEEALVEGTDKEGTGLDVDLLDGQDITESLTATEGE